MSCREDDAEPRNHLRAWREYRRLTQAQLATLVGTEGSVISLLESGDRGLSDKWLRRLAPALGTTSGHLLAYAPDQVGQAFLDSYRLVPEVNRPELVASLARELRLQSQSDKPIARSKKKS